MYKTTVIDNSTDKAYLARAVHLQRAFIAPFSINDFVWILIHNKPTRVIVTDVGINSIQLNGRWYTWEEAREEHGGVFESEFEALSAMSV